MQTYRVYLKNTDSCFFDGEASSRENAIAQAEAEYYEKYPECEGEIVEWSVVEQK
ncbi:MAG: hypothetical protein WAW61_19130 [Methylococcaceae bacterium]